MNLVFLLHLVPGLICGTSFPHSIYDITTCA
jgi:hypothetical protein